ncbi:hypothetical protein SAMN06265338_1411, partial [Rhodoblastus acidophilus]
MIAKPLIDALPSGGCSASACGSSAAP